MARVKGCEAVYAVADQWRERCLADDKSLLWPDEVTWTVENIEAAKQLFQQVGSNKEDFWAKLGRLLADQPLEVGRVVTDLTALYNLANGWMKVDQRRSYLKLVLDAIGESEPASIDIILKAFSQEFIDAATPYLNKDVNLTYLADVALGVKKSRIRSPIVKPSKLSPMRLCNPLGAALSWPATLSCTCCFPTTTRQLPLKVTRRRS